MQITSAMVKELRERTGAGMMDCKNALQEAGGDIETAIEAMRKSGVAKAAKKAGRIAAEGNIIIDQNPATGDTVILEVNSETDFVAKDRNFRSFGDDVAACILANHPADIEKLMVLPIRQGSDQTVEETRQQLVAKIGENISVRRFALVQNKETRLGTYSHGTRIGVIVSMLGGDDALAKDIAMQVAAMAPVAVDKSDVDSTTLERELEIAREQVRAEGKPEEMVEKIAQGKIAKFYKESTLLNQEFIKDSKKTIRQYLEGFDKELTVTGFKRIILG